MHQSHRSLHGQQALQKLLPGKTQLWSKKVFYNVVSQRFTFCSSRVCAAGVCRPSCWWMRSSPAWRWKCLIEPLTRATPDWPTSPLRPEEAELMKGTDNKTFKMKTVWGKMDEVLSFDKPMRKSQRKLTLNLTTCCIQHSVWGSKMLH